MHAFFFYSNSQNIVLGGCRERGSGVCHRLRSISHHFHVGRPGRADEAVNSVRGCLRRDRGRCFHILHDGGSMCSRYYVVLRISNITIIINNN